MKIEINAPDITEFDIRMDKSDKLFTQCRWAKFRFDNKNWSMESDSDCGNYSYYGWQPEDKRTFLELMAVIDGYYLLDKISSRVSFDQESTEKNVIQHAKWLDLEKEVRAILGNIRHCGSSSEEFMIAFREVCAEIECDGVPLSEINLYECIEHDYPKTAKDFVDIFTEVLQPEIRKYIGKQQIKLK